jgi:hypothetical protein
MVLMAFIVGSGAVNLAQMLYVDTDTDDHFDIITDATFDGSLENSDSIGILSIVANTLSHKGASNLFDQLVSLEVTPESIRIRLRYLNSEKVNQSSSGQAIEDASRLKVQFIFYLFAKIDQVHKLQDHPFTPRFREFLELLDDLFR